MPLPDGDLRLIRDRGPGWEAAWHRLWTVLHRRLHEWVKPGPLNQPNACRLNRKHFGVLGGVDEADEFIAEFLLRLAHRASEGTLLAGYDLEAGSDVCSYLIRVAPSRAKSHMMRKRLHLPLHEQMEQRGGGGERRATPDPAGCFSEIDHPPGETLDAVVRHAAMQVHPRLERTVANFETLEQDLRRTLRPGSHRSSLDHLAVRHAEARRRLAEALATVAEATRSSRRPESRLGPGRLRAMEGRCLRLECDRIISPLDHDAVRALLALSAQAARQQNSRYRKRENLLRLFPRLRRLVEGHHDGRLDWVLEGTESDAEDPA